MHRCGMFCTGPAEPMDGHDEAPFLNGRGLRVGAEGTDDLPGVARLGFRAPTGGLAGPA